MRVFILVLIKFFLISALFIVSNGNLHIGDSVERGIFLDSYSTWMNNVYSQGAQIVGYVVNSRWLPDEDLGWIEPERANRSLE